MAVTWWMPGTLSGISVGIPLTPYPDPMEICGHLSCVGKECRYGNSCGSAGFEVLRSLRFDARPDLGGHRLLQLLLEVGDEPDRASHHGQPAADLPGQLELARDGSDGARRVDRQGLSGGPRHGFPDELHQLHVATVEAV